MKTLFISDLDGTLLGSNVRLSEFTIRTINALIRRGLVFSYATARSVVTAAKVTAGLSAEFPVITYNGAFIINSATQEILLSNYFTGDEAQYIQQVLTESQIYPIVYATIDGKEKFSYFRGHTNRGKQFFLDSRIGDVRRIEADSAEDVYRGDMFYISCIGDEEKLELINDIFKADSRFSCIYQRDIYSGVNWFEILPARATKANAILQLKSFLGCDRIVSFGDSKNDLSMFEISDECYAVENACEELKEIATAIIDSNDNDGVAKWLEENAGDAYPTDL